MKTYILRIWLHTDTVPPANQAISILCLPGTQLIIPSPTFRLPKYQKLHITISNIIFQLINTLSITLIKFSWSFQTLRSSILLTCSIISKTQTPPFPRISTNKPNQSLISQLPPSNYAVSKYSKIEVEPSSNAENDETSHPRNNANINQSMSDSVSYPQVFFLRFYSLCR